MHTRRTSRQDAGEVCINSDNDTIGGICQQFFHAGEHCSLDGLPFEIVSRNEIEDDADSFFGIRESTVNTRGFYIRSNLVLRHAPAYPRSVRTESEYGGGMPCFAKPYEQLE